VIWQQRSHPVTHCTHDQLETRGGGRGDLRGNAMRMMKKLLKDGALDLKKNS
jgi:hypothetical protein